MARVALDPPDLPPPHAFLSSTPERSLERWLVPCVQNMLEGPVRFFVHQYTKYVWDADALAFEQLQSEYVFVYSYSYPTFYCTLTFTPNALALCRRPLASLVLASSQHALRHSQSVLFTCILYASTRVFELCVNTDCAPICAS